MITFIYINDSLSKNLPFFEWRDIFSNYELTANTGYVWTFDINAKTGYNLVGIVSFGYSVVSGEINSIIINPTLSTDSKKLMLNIRNISNTNIIGANVSGLFLWMPR